MVTRWWRWKMTKWQFFTAGFTALLKTFCELEFSECNTYIENDVTNLHFRCNSSEETSETFLFNEWNTLIQQVKHFVSTSETHLLASSFVFLARILRFALYHLFLGTLNTRLSVDWIALFYIIWALYMCWIWELHSCALLFGVLMVLKTPCFVVATEKCLTNLRYPVCCLSASRQFVLQAHLRVLRMTLELLLLGRVPKFQVRAPWRRAKANAWSLRFWCVAD